MTDDVIIFFSVDHFSRGVPQKFSYWSDVAFHICNYDVIKKKNHTSSPWRVLVMCQVSIFSLCGFRDTEVQRFSVFPIWLPQHVTYDVIIINATFCMSSHTKGENFVSIQQAVAKKNTKALCGQKNWQTDRQTNRQTDKQTNEKSLMEWQLGKTAQSRMALGRVHISARWNSSHFVSHWWAGCETKSNLLVLVTYPTHPPCFIITQTQLFEI